MAPRPNPTRGIFLPKLLAIPFPAILPTDLDPSLAPILAPKPPSILPPRAAPNLVPVLAAPLLVAAPSIFLARTLPPSPNPGPLLPNPALPPPAAPAPRRAYAELPEKSPPCSNAASSADAFACLASFSDCCICADAIIPCCCVCSLVAATSMVVTIVSLSID